MGPRYRVGFKDLALVASLAKDKSYALREEDEVEGEAAPFLFAEALEHLDEVEGLSDEGRARLEERSQELAALRVEARRPVGEFLGEIIRRTGILTELDAHLDVASAAAARRNLAAFLDEVHSFSPIQGELTLRAFLEYVDAVENLDKQEWSPVQPSEEDSVKVMTIHVAKGLEFDHVFVPGLAKGLLPNTTIQHNPAERGKSMDFELRGDAAYLPRYEGNLSAFKKDLQKQEEYEERRTAYVAMTRARRTLHVTGAHWYAENLRAKEAGPFLRELKDWGDRDEARHVGSGRRHRRGAQSDPRVPRALRPGLARSGPAVGVGPRVPRGMATGGDRSRGRGAVQGSLLEALADEDRAAMDRLAADRRGLAIHLREREAAEGLATEVAPPRTVSVGGVIDYTRCPKRFYWSHVRPLPGSPDLPPGSGPRSIGGSNAAPRARDSCSSSRTRPTSRPRNSRVSRARWTASARRSSPAGSRARSRCSPSARSSCGSRASRCRADRRGLRGVARGALGGRGLEDRGPSRRGRPARRPPARPLRPRVRRGVGTEAGGPHAHLPLPRGRRGGLASDGRPGRRPGPRHGVVGSDRPGRLRTDPGRWCRHCDFLSFCDTGRAWAAAQSE